jgi:hypothetical protein
MLFIIALLKNLASMLKRWLFFLKDKFNILILAASIKKVFYYAGWTREKSLTESKRAEP